MSRDGRQQRIGSRYLPRIIFVVSSVFFVLLVTISWNIVTALPSQRTTVVVAGDPVQIVSWDNARGQLTIIPVPSDVYLDGAFGVGSLPLASLRKLEALDGKKKGVFVKSLEDALAVPIVGDPTLALRFRLWWIQLWLRPDAVSTFDLALRGVLPSDVLADGSQVRVFDINRFDAVIANRLEVDAIRREELRVRVINTTDVAGKGNRAARMLSHAGMVVVAVESEPPTQNACSVHAKKELWDSQTGRFIQKEFLCAATETETDEHVDLTIRLGSD